MIPTVPTYEFLCVTSHSPEMSAQTLVCQTARSGPLSRDIFLGPRGTLPLVLAARPQATRLGKSARLLLAGPLYPGPLGPATVTDDRHRQARTLVRWTTRSRSWCVVGGVFTPLSPSLPAEPRLLDPIASAASRVIRLLRHWGYQSGIERVSPLHLSRLVVLLVRPVPAAYLSYPRPTTT